MHHTPEIRYSRVLPPGIDSQFSLHSTPRQGVSCGVALQPFPGASGLYPRSALSKSQTRRGWVLGGDPDTLLYHTSLTRFFRHGCGKCHISIETRLYANDGGVQFSLNGKSEVVPLLQPASPTSAGAGGGE
eukprot:gene18279-biopygen20435